MITGKVSWRKLDWLILPLIVVLVGVAAFSLGRLSALEEQKSELKILYDQTR